MKKSYIYVIIAVGITALLGFNFAVNPLTLNRSPDINANSHEVLAGSVVLSADIRDEEGDALTYNWTQLSGDAVIIQNGTSANPTFTIEPTATNRTLTFQVLVDDGTSRRSSTISVLVLANQPPTANAGEDQVVNKGATVIVDGSKSSDPENGALVYKWAQVGGPQLTLIDPESAKPTFIVPAFSGEKVITYQLIVSDGISDSKPDTVKITINANKAPTADAGPDEKYNKNNEVTLSGEGSFDPDDDELAYQWKQTSGPEVKLSDPKSAKPTFIVPSFESDRILTFQLIVNDGASDSKPDTVKITAKANRIPVADAGPDLTVDAENRVNLTATDSKDPDGDKLTYEWKQTSGPEVKLSDPKSAKPWFKALTIEGEKVLVFELTVNDGMADSKQDTVKITVKGNKLPIANAGPDQNVKGEIQVTLDGSKSADPEKEKLTYQWKQTSGPEVKLSDAKVIKPTFKAPEAGGADKVLVFELVVSDGISESKPDTVKITVKANRVPVADAGPDQRVDEGDTVVLDGTDSRDPDGDKLTYQWKQISGTPTVSLTGAKDSEASFKAPSVSTAKVFKFQLTVNDGKLSKTDVVEITVRPD